MRNWWEKQKEEFKLQRALASRDSAAKKHRALYNAELAKTEKQAKAKGDCDPYDLLMERYNQRMNIRDNPEKFRAIEKANEKAGKQHGNATGCSMALDRLYGEKNMDNINKDNMKGRGLGAWLGRLVTGRRDSGVRATGVEAHKAHMTQTGFNHGEMQEVWKLQQCEAEIRSGALKPEEVLAREMDSFGKKYDAEKTIAKMKNQTMENRNKPAGPESTEFIEQFRWMSRERACMYERIHAEHGMDFFPQHYDNDELNTSKANAEMYPQNTNGSKTLDRLTTRVTLARAYMYSQGCTLEQIYGDTDADKALRTKYGKEMMQKLSGSMEDASKMYADIAKKLSDFPMPDMTSDAAIYENMRDIDFARNAGIDLSQIINLRDEDKENKRPYHALEQAFHDNLTDKEYERFNIMNQYSQGIVHNGIDDRITLMRTGDYSQKPVSYNKDMNGKDKAVRSPFQQMLMGLTTEKKDYIQENYVPGKKMGDGRPILHETMKYREKKEMEVARNYDYEETEKKVVGTITNDQVRQIQKQVFNPNPKPKVKVNEQAKQDFSKELLGDKKKNVATVNNHDRKGLSPPSPKKRETKI